MKKMVLFVLILAVAVSIMAGVTINRQIVVNDIETCEELETYIGRDGVNNFIEFKRQFEETYYGNQTYVEPKFVMFEIHHDNMQINVMTRSMLGYSNSESATYFYTFCEANEANTYKTIYVEI